MYGCGSASIPAYDNAGYLREEIPLIENNAIGLVIGEAGMYVAPSGGCVAKLSVTGEVPKGEAGIFILYTTVSTSAPSSDIRRSLT